MAETFAPLPRPGPSLKANGFAPLNLKSVASSNGASSLGAGTGGGADGAHAHEPVVTLERDGEKITSIRIQCACGQVMNLHCEY